MPWARQARNPFWRAHASSLWMERGLTPEYTSIRRWETSFAREGRTCPTAVSVSTRVAMGRLRLGDDHLGELPAHEHAAGLVLSDVLGHHVGFAPTLELVDRLAARAAAHPEPDGLQEVELHPGVQPGVHDVLAVPQVQRLIGHQRGRRGLLREPGMVVLHREAVRLDVLRDHEMVVGDELLADLQRIEGELPELGDLRSRHTRPPAPELRVA